MSYAFEGIQFSKWNNEVIAYLASKFNTINPRFMVLSKSVFINAALAKFDNVSFVINGANECLELSFAKVDTEKMEPLIEAILSWDEFTKHSDRFYVKVDNDLSRSVVFTSGKTQTPNAFRRHFSKYEVEVVKTQKKEL